VHGVWPALVRRRNRSDATRIQSRIHQLNIHRDRKEFPVYAIAIAKGGPKLQESATNSDAAVRPGTVNVAASGSGAGVGVDLGGGSFFSLANNRVEIRKMTMPARKAPLDVIVVDAMQKAPTAN
jgi:hypothetical protein